MRMQDYLSPNEIGIHEAKFIFHLRTRMIDVRTNFSGSYVDLRCPLCKREEDTQKHLLECSKLNVENDLVSSLPTYCDIFSEKLELKVGVA